MIILDMTSSQQFTVADQTKIREQLNQEQVIVYPTDTLYGLGADACSDKAVAELYRLKAREDAPVSVLVQDTDDLLSMLAEPSDQAVRLIQTFLPGALTVIGASHYPFAQQLVSRKGTVGFRVPGDVLSRQIPALIGHPITTTSVNPAGATPASSQDEVQAYYAGQVPLMIDIGKMSPSKGSTVIDLSTTPFNILREGEITRQQLEDFLN